MTWLSNIIKASMSCGGAVITYIFGEIGVGKTSYALYTAKEVYGNWEEALEWLFFDIKDMIPKLKEAFMQGRRIPVVIIDDAGLWANKMYWWELPVREFTKLFNVIRSMVGSVIFTSPTDEIPQQLIKKIKYRISVTKAGEKNGIPISKATIYKQYILPDFTPRVKKIVEEFFPRHYPIYDEYSKKRGMAIATKLEEMEVLLKMEGIGSRKGYQSSREEFIRFVIGGIAKRLKEGKTFTEVRTWLKSLGITDGTIYHWISRVEQLLMAGIDPVEAALSGMWKVKVGRWMYIMKKIKEEVSSPSYPSTVSHS